MGWRRHPCTARALYLPQPMNVLIVGRDKTNTFLQYLRQLTHPFLLIDGGSLIDALLPTYRKEISQKTLTHFQVKKHSFNTLENNNHKRAREIAASIYAASPYGDSTLTVRNGRRALAKLTLEATYLDTITGDKKNPAIAEALATLDDMFLSPVLKKVLCKPTNFPLDGTILARLNRAELGEFDYKILVYLLLATYKGQVVAPEFGSFGTEHHVSLIDQDRLIAGMNFLDEIPKLKNQLVLIEDKILKHCTTDDAETLAPYCGYAPTITGYSEFIKASIE